GDVGATLRVAVTAANAAGSATATSPPSGVIHEAGWTVAQTIADGATIAGPVPWGATAGGIDPSDITDVVFAIDGAPRWTEHQAPYDYGGGAGGTLDTTGLAPGTHTFDVTATAVDGTSASVSAAATVVPPAPPVSTAPPTIDGPAQQGRTLTASPGSWSGQPAPVFTYDWQRCDDAGASCQDIDSADVQAYLVLDADIGARLRVVVTATNMAGAATAASAPTAMVAASPPTSVRSPEAIGLAVQDRTLGADPGTWTGRPSEYAYQWQRCDATGAACAPIPGATGAKYGLFAAADIGATLRVSVTARNGAGSGTAISPPSAVVQRASSAPWVTSRLEALGRLLGLQPWRRPPP
ncbi:MAG TPA: hypothetical protein VGQ83_31870, partial [Polyangia bacterium]